MEYIADLHIHSRFSRATSKEMSLENIYITAQLKGIAIIATGDVTHPEWIDEIRQKLEADGSGFFKLKKEWRMLCDEKVPVSCRREVRFLLNGEICNIYKKKGKTRKTHNLVFFPDIASVQKFNKKLNRVGNIQSDGRPILKLDAKHLLELVLETNKIGFLIPAHIWTPWFSILGAKSGFNSIEACFEDLSRYIFAVETGLSSDPLMNRQVPFLDRLALVSNSDAHSPDNIGREANLFNIERSYLGLIQALKRKKNDKFLGTYEFHAEEGKYFMDGHRKCDICLKPEETRKFNGVCPKCGKKLTVGVLHRIDELSEKNRIQKQQQSTPFKNSISLFNILSEILKVGPKSKTVRRFYRNMLAQFGSELDILHTVDIEKLKRTDTPELIKAISRMRQNKINIIPGYDGKFGKVSLLE